MKALGSIRIRFTKEHLVSSDLNEMYKRPSSLKPETAKLDGISKPKVDFCTCRPRCCLIDPFYRTTGQVDRKCHLISASTFDKMCADMKQQADDMSDDLHAHGARELVATALVANNLAAAGSSR